MRFTKIYRLLAALVFTLVIIAGGLVQLSGCSLLSYFGLIEGGRTIDDDYSDIKDLLRRADMRLRQSLDIVESSDEDGNTILVGVPDATLEAYLEDLVSAYNADPSTDHLVIFEDVRFSLTEGIAEASHIENRDIGLEDFLFWTSRLTDLVYRENLYDNSGNLVHTANEPFGDNHITNYLYIINADTGFSDLRCSWEQN